MDRNENAPTPHRYQFTLEAVERPVVDKSHASALVQQQWGLPVLSIKELGSYEDRNYLVTCRTGVADQTVHYVLKVHNLVFSSMPGFVEGIRAPVAEPTASDSRLIVDVQQPNGPSKARLLKFIPGTTLKAAKKTPALLQSVGHYLAQLDLALRDFYHPGIRPTHDWAITHVADAVQQLCHLLDHPKHVEIAQKVSKLLETIVMPGADSLRKQVIHSDANENNIIIDETKQQVVALIDWSDITECWLIAEVAISAAYVLLMTMIECDRAQRPAEQQALEAVAHLVGGYNQQLPLTDQEWLLLPVLMAGRLMHSTLIGYYTVSKEPGNAEYVMPDEPYRWQSLELLLCCEPQQLTTRLRAMAEASIHAGSCRHSNAAELGCSRQPGPQGGVSPSSLPTPLPPFKLELYLARYEQLPLQLSRSSCQPLKLHDLLALADPTLQEQWRELELSYPPNSGSLQLRQEVSLQYHGTGPEHVLSCVPNEGIYITMTALLSPGDVVVAMYPAYQTLIEVARSVGAHVKLWNMDIEPSTGRAYFSLDVLHSLITPDVKCLVVNVPHNPSGWLPTQHEWADIIRSATEVGAWLFSDEIYRLLEQQPEQQRLPPAVSCYPTKGISLGGLSKAFGLQGLRSGWLVCRDTQLLQQAENVKSYITTTGPIMSELLAIIALRNQEYLVGRCAEIIRKNIAVAGAFFARWPSMFAWHPPSAGSLCLPRLTTGEPIDAFCERAAAGCGVVILPATVYHHAAATAGQHFRLGLGRTNFEEALEVLERWLQATEQQQQQRQQLA